MQETETNAKDILIESNLFSKSDFAVSKMSFSKNGNVSLSIYFSSMHFLTFDSISRIFILKHSIKIDSLQSNFKKMSI